MNKATRKAHEDRMAMLHAKAQQVVATGQCPLCGTGLVRNLALTGWWQCGGYATGTHRQPQFAGVAKCDFQTFKE